MRVSGLHPPGLTPADAAYSAGERQRAEQRLVEKLIPQPPVEALALGILLRLAGLNVLPADAALVRPLQDSFLHVCEALGRGTRRCDLL